LLFNLNSMISIFRKEHFNAAHRLHNPNLSESANIELYGKCNNPNYHGHNYELIVKLTGEIDPDTGYLYDTKKLSNLIKEHIIEKFDHKNINLDVEEIKGIIPTTENLVINIYNILRNKIDTRLQLKIILYETERNFVEYPA